MKKVLSYLKKVADFIDAEDDPREPAYDPVHLGTLLIVLMVTIGALYWLLWTLLVYEGGLFVKIAAAFDVLLAGKTLKDYGWLGSHTQGVFEGWAGNIGALILTSVAVSALYRAYWRIARRAPK